MDVPFTALEAQQRAASSTVKRALAVHGYLRESQRYHTRIGHHSHRIKDCDRRGEHRVRLPGLRPTHPVPLVASLLCYNCPTSDFLTPSFPV